MLDCTYIILGGYTKQVYSHSQLNFIFMNVNINFFDCFKTNFYDLLALISNLPHIYAIIYLLPFEHLFLELLLRFVCVL